MRYGSAILASFLEALSCLASASLCATRAGAQTTTSSVSLVVTVKGGASSQGSGKVLEGGAVKYSANQLPATFAISAEPGGTDPLNLTYVLAISLGSNREEQFYLNIRDVHLGKRFDIEFDGAAIDATQGSSLVSRACPTQQGSWGKLTQSYVTCRDLYYNVFSGDTLDRFRALRGWFDAAVRLAAIPSSILSLDPDVERIVRQNEEQAGRDTAFAGRYRALFPERYAETAISSTKKSRLTDLRAIPSIVQAGDHARALKVNEFATFVFNDLAAQSQAAPTSFVANGVNQTLLIGNKNFLETLASRMTAPP